MENPGPDPPRLSQVSTALLTVATLALAPSAPSCAGNARLCKWCDLIPPHPKVRTVHNLHTSFSKEKSNRWCHPCVQSNKVSDGDGKLSKIIPLSSKRSFGVISFFIHTQHLIPHLCSPKIRSRVRHLERWSHSTKREV